MESNTTDQEFPGAESPLNEPVLKEPHFDEEATVLSARPVVPLEEIKANTRFRRPWVVGLAIAGALLVGVTATAFFFSRQSANTSRAFADSNAIISGARALESEPERRNNFRPAITEVTSDPVAPADSETELPLDSEPSDEPSDSSPRNSKKPEPRLVEVITSKPDRDLEKRIREERKEARREEKRRKRDARREMREGGSSDDLLRIREIFEGRHKP
jgi:hypothetical protein